VPIAAGKGKSCNADWGGKKLVVRSRGLKKRAGLGPLVGAWGALSPKGKRWRGWAWQGEESALDRAGGAMFKHSGGKEADEERGGKT